MLYTFPMDETPADDAQPAVCPICARNIPSDSVWCPYCGSARTANPPKQKQKKEKQAKTVLAAAAVALLALATIVLFVFGVLHLTNAIFTSSEPYKTAMALVRQSDDAALYLGSGVERKGIVSGSMSGGGQTGSAQLNFRVGGTEGEGIVYVTAQKSAGEWTYISVSFYPAGHPDEAVDLLGQQ